MSPSPYPVRASAPAAKVLDSLPEHAEDTVWDIPAAAAADPWGFRQFDTADDQGEDDRYAAVGRLFVTYRTNRPLHRLTVPNTVWLGSHHDNGPAPALQLPAPSAGEPGSSAAEAGPLRGRDRSRLRK
ncbi:hypothetical protein [Streptomyces sp. NPDC094049]|uniref:hypothetical protein n=1 Tax=Streptomyces sp. NPDC094049 TaxID=3154987 RepID=UPI0033165C0F